MLDLPCIGLSWYLACTSERGSLGGLFLDEEGPQDGSPDGSHKQHCSAQVMAAAKICEICRMMQVKARVLFLAWSWSGSILALAQEGGCISLRDSAGAELGLGCSHNRTVAGIAWRPLRSGLVIMVASQHIHDCQNSTSKRTEVETRELMLHCRNEEDNELAVLSSDGFLSFHGTSGKAAGKSVSLGRPATALAYFDSGEQDGAASIIIAHALLTSGRTLGTVLASVMPCADNSCNACRRVYVHCIC